jgi:hypothetical protein
MRSWALPMLRSLVVIALAGLAACEAGSLRHPLAGRTKPVHGEPGYWIYLDDGWLHLRVTTGERGHRFQGSLAVQKGQLLGALELDRPSMAEQVAAQGNSVQFDLEPGRNAEEGFRVHTDQACLRFDLYVDGAHRAERIHLGARRLSPRAVPFERCP